MSQPDLMAALEPVIRALEHLAVPYSIVGSVASSAHGIARASVDADLVVDLAATQVLPLVAALAGDYYVDADAVLDAVQRRSMFNVVHLSTMLKVDLYLLGRAAFERESFARRLQFRLDSASSRAFAVASPEDIVLHKLEWYRKEGDVSDRQWSDVVGVLRVQGDALDRGYLDEWAKMAGVSDLLDRARREAGA